jgi:hypothetical protein
MRFSRVSKLSALGLLAVSSSVIGCSKNDDNKGRALGLPKVKPPVETSAPTGIKGAALLFTQQDDSSPLKTLASRFFSKGPTDILERLAQVDSRLSEMDTRSQETEKACLSTEATAWTLPAALPSSTSFPLYFQCVDKFGDIQIGFGVKDNNAYLAEIQKASTSGANSPQAATLVKANMDGSSTEAWITMQSFDNSASVSAEDYFFLAIKGDSATKGFEVSVGGKGQGIGVDCGVRVKSDGTSIYAKGIFASFGSLGEDCTGAGTDNKAESVELCADAATLAAVDAAKCASLKTFTLPELTHIGLAAAGGLAASDAFVAADITGFGDFAEEKK